MSHSHKRPVLLAHRLQFVGTQLAIEAQQEPDPEERRELRRAASQLHSASRLAIHPARRLEAEAFLDAGITLMCRRFAHQIERTTP